MTTPPDAPDRVRPGDAGVLADEGPDDAGFLALPELTAAALRLYDDDLADVGYATNASRRRVRM